MKMCVCVCVHVWNVRKMHVLRKVYPGFFRFLLLCNDDSRFSFFLYMGDARSQTITQKREREREGEGPTDTRVRFT